ncbi:MAG TPA: tetratricopeptide repeat protein [Planctomycetota bacterium]|nr:tetratricopeptide repeat protein [Planctomycetota bacterium]
MRALVLCVAAAACCAGMRAQEDPLAEGLRLYRAGDFARAHECFTTALAMPDAPHGDVLFHLGNAAFRLDRPAEALWHYRRALGHLPRDAELRANVAVVEARLGVEPPPATLGEVLLAPLARLTAGEQLGLATALQVVGVLVWFAARRRATVRAVAAAAGLAGLALGVRVAVQQAWPQPTSAVVLQASALRAEPDAGAATILALRPGETVRVAGEHGDWIEVTHPLATGFVARAAVGLVDGT